METENTLSDISEIALSESKNGSGVFYDVNNGDVTILGLRAQGGTQPSRWCCRNKRRIYGIFTLGAVPSVRGFNPCSTKV